MISFDVSKEDAAQINEIVSNIGSLLDGVQNTQEWIASVSNELDRLLEYSKKIKCKVPDDYVMVNKGALRMVINALRRDAEDGRTVRGEIADALVSSIYDPIKEEPK